ELGRSPDVEEVEAAARRDGLELPTGLLDVRLHDLRRTVGSWMSQASIDLNTIKEALRHSSISTTLTYARLGADPARQAMEEHGRRVMEIAGRQRVVETPRQKE
ncbi:MAG: tyrosine-type recombinase/integrase, partial [Planctomycetes bacterium]|nr:tyrosine-type recombinase/integrase [Planctomycetota bacterium]